MEFTNRATKTYYNNFIKAVEKIETINMIEKPAAYKSQLSQLEINLKNIKKFEPNLDISELESQFNFFKNAISSSDNQKSIEKDLESHRKNNKNDNNLSCWTTEPPPMAMGSLGMLAIA